MHALDSSVATCSETNMQYVEDGTHVGGEEKDDDEGHVGDAAHVGVGVTLCTGRR